MPLGKKKMDRWPPLTACRSSERLNTFPAEDIDRVMLRRYYFTFARRGEIFN